MRKITLLFMLWCSFAIVSQAQTLVYSGSSDPEQINGPVFQGEIQTDGDVIVATNNWASLSITSAADESSRALQSTPSSFDIKWKYEDGSIMDGVARGISIKYKPEWHDEFRCMIDTTTADGLVMFWAHWGEGGLAGNGNWTETGVGFPGATFTSPLNNIPDETLAFKVTFDGEKYEAYYGADGQWVNVPEMTLTEADFPQFGAHSLEENEREWLINTAEGESRIDWLKLTGEGVPAFNADVVVDDPLFSDTPIAEEGMLVYSGSDDTEQINGEVVAGEINSDGEYIVATGNWTSVSIAQGTDDASVAKQAIPSAFEAKLKYEAGTLTDGEARGFTIKYNSEWHDEFRFMLDTTTADGLVMFWAHWGEGGLAGNGEWVETGVGFPGATFTSPLNDIPDDAIAFRITFDGNKYEAYYGQGDDGWVMVPGMTLNSVDFPSFDAHSLPENMREFQINTATDAESRLDWLKITGPGIPEFNADAQVSDNLFTTDDVITDIKDIEINFAKVYPNPVSDLVFIEGENIKNIVLVNVLGQTVMQKSEVNSSRIRLNLNAMKSGYYFLQITDQSNRIITKRIIKK